MADLPPDTYLGKLLRQLGKSDGDGVMTEDDLAVILDFEEEQFRLGNFEKIFPCINNVSYYGQFFECQRSANHLLMRYLTIISPKHNVHHVCHVPTAPVIAPGAQIKRHGKRSVGKTS